MSIHTDVLNVKQHFESQVTKEVKYRRKHLKALKKEIQKREKDIIAALKQDLGKSKLEAYATEIGIVLKSLGYFIKEVKNLSRTTNISTPMFLFPAKSYLMPEPYGTVLIIGPFNYPFQLVMEPLIGAIAAGNTAVVKPSELTPATSDIIKEIIEAVFPPEYVNVQLGDVEVSKALLEERYDFIFFTGSTTVGQIVYEAASKHLTPVALELGGKSPTIIDKTANIKVAAERIAFGKFMNAGQTCIAPDYVLVDAAIKEKLIKAIHNTLKEFYGQDIKKSPDYGRIVSDKHFDRLQGLIDNASHKIAIGGQSDKAERYIEPTILDDVSLKDDVMKEEIFGPILPIISYNDKSEIFNTIKQFEKPLALYLFTEDDNFAEDVLKRVSFGGGCINDTLLHVSNPNLPFGGVGHSGIGRYHGRYSFETFSHQKSYMTKSTKLETGMMFPPYKGKLKYIRQVFK